jgi:hypothetical protein
MKKLSIIVFGLTTAIIFYNCSNAKKVTTTPAPAYTYESNVKSVITTSCSPCHIPSKGGKIKAYDNFANTKSDIDEIIRRIELNPGQPGFMPFKHPKLSDSAIAVFKQWKTDGMVEN